MRRCAKNISVVGDFSAEMIFCKFNENSTETVIFKDVFQCNQFFFLACLLYFSNTRRRDLKQFYAWIKIYKVSDCKIIITFCSLLILVYCPLRKTLQIFIKKTLYNFLCECYCCNENLKFKKIWNVEDTYKSIYQYFWYRFFLLSSLL